MPACTTCSENKSVCAQHTFQWHSLSLKRLGAIKTNNCFSSFVLRLQRLLPCCLDCLVGPVLTTTGDTPGTYPTLLAMASGHTRSSTSLISSRAAVAMECGTSMRSSSAQTGEETNGCAWTRLPWFDRRVRGSTFDLLQLQLLWVLATALGRRHTVQAYARKSM